MKLPTQQQLKVLKFITNFIQRFSYAPSTKEMREYLNLKSDNAIIKHVDALQKKGYLRRRKSKSGKALPRSIQLTNLKKSK